MVCCKTHLNFKSFLLFIMMLDIVITFSYLKKKKLYTFNFHNKNKITNTFSRHVVYILRTHNLTTQRNTIALTKSPPNLMNHIEGNENENQRKAKNVVHTVPLFCQASKWTARKGKQKRKVENIFVFDYRSMCCVYWRRYNEQAFLLGSQNMHRTNTI